MALGPPRKGIKLTYCTDTRPTESIAKMPKIPDLFICEGMYAEKEKLAKAKQYKHMTFMKRTSCQGCRGERNVALPTSARPL